MHRWLYFLLIIFSNSLHGSEEKEIFNEITALYGRYGNARYMIGEEVTQANHVLQAALIATRAGAPEDVIIALLLHDIGQIAEIDHLGELHYLHASHDEIGADWLQSRNFPLFVCDVVRFHTLAKVQLCHQDPQYYDTLSQASKDSYHIQRDKFLNQPEIVDAFLKHPRMEDILYARKCDDLAKISEMIHLPEFDDYFEMFQRVYQGRQKNPANNNWRETIETWHRWGFKARIP